MFQLFYIILCVILLVITLSLALKIHLLHSSFLRISEGLTDILEEGVETNALLTLVSRDRHLCRMTAVLNRQLKLLRKEHLRYVNGDRDLREAIANISHDLRTPLTTINGYLDLLCRELAPVPLEALQEETTESRARTEQTENREKSQNVQRYLNMIRSRTEAMKQLTEELFHYSITLSARKEDPVSLSLNQVLEESLISFYQELEEHHITPVIQMPQAPVLRTLDKASLVRVFGNIIGNAVKYSQGDLRITLTKQGSVIFSNQAPGLTPVTAAKLFDRYFTVETVSASGSPRPRTTGGGLGLSIAKLLTEQMGGSVNAAYKDGELHITVQFPSL